jgi:endo-chitodextinase
MVSVAVPSKDAARLLTQATFGANALEMKRVGQMGISAWIDDQMLRPPASHMQYVNEASLRRGGTPAKPKYTEEDSYEAIWQQWLWGPDQLRARMAFALSEIMVISNTAPDMYADAMSSYMDILNKYAFGNYRDLLEAVTLSPAMGYYLNMMGSEKEDTKNNKKPNENYARESLQLFSVGLYLLNPDGTRKIGNDGKPINTYDEETVRGFADAFTGWNFAGNDTTKPSAFSRPKENWIDGLKAWPTKHSTGTKKLLNGTVLPAGQTAEMDMKMALDNMANHPNVGPFIGKQLIQRFVTSNPSPAYVARVSAVFDNNGSGARGDLGATLKAILTDDEARLTTHATQAAQANNPKWGKQREPVIRFANVLRAFDATSKNGRNKIHYLDSSDDALGQSPLLAPSVFNFFSPTYTRPGKLAQAGIVAPEFQITNEIQTIGTANFFYNVVRNEGYGSGDTKVKLDLSNAKAIANDATKLVDYLAGLFSHGELTPTTRQLLLETVNALPIKGNNGAGSTNERTARVRAALTLILLAPDFVIQQ